MLGFIEREFSINEKAHRSIDIACIFYAEINAQPVQCAHLFRNVEELKARCPQSG
jgi:hypothetical protein